MGSVRYLCSFLALRTLIANVFFFPTAEVFSPRLLPPTCNMKRRETNMLQENPTLSAISNMHYFLQKIERA